MRKCFLIMFLLLPFNVFALSLECPNVVSPTEEFVCTISDDELIGLSANIFGSDKVNYSNFVVSDDTKAYYYDKNGFNIHSVSSLHANLSFLVANDVKKGEIYQVSLKNIEGVDKNYRHIKKDDIIKNIQILSDVHTLKNIVLSGGSIPIKFKKDTFRYEVSTTDSSIDIQATLNDAASKLEGDIGKKNLNIGANIFNIKVTSERGNVSTYQIVVVRNVKTSEKSIVKEKGLKSLSVNGTEVKLSSNQFSYQLDVASDVETVDIQAIAKQINGDVSISDIGQLSFGKNDITIQVKDSDGQVIQYVLTINRAAKQDNRTTIKKLSIDHYFINFSSDVLKYQVSIRDEESLNLLVDLDSSTSKYEIVGNEHLKNHSIIQIKVTSLDGNSQIYEIEVLKDNSIMESNSLSIANYKFVFGAMVILITIMFLLYANKKRQVHKF